MIPLLHIQNILSTLFCYLVAKRLYSSYQKTHDVNIGDFFKAFSATGIYFLLVSLPAALSSPAQVQIVYILSYIPLILGPIFLLKIAFRTFHIRYGRPLFFLMYSLVVVITVLNTIFFAPAHIRAFKDIFYHWGEGTPLWLETFNGVLVGILLFGCAFLFLIGGRKSEEKLVQGRSRRIGIGIAILFFASLLNYVVAPPLQGISIWGWAASIFASWAALIGLILILLGIYYRREGDISNKAT